MVVTFCSSAAVHLKAGANRSSSLTDDQYTQLINQAESFINDRTQINFTTLYSGLSDDLKKILEDAASSHAALSAINFDMSGYSSLAEAQTMLDLNYVRFTDIIRELKEKKTTDFIQGT